MAGTVAGWAEVGMVGVEETAEVTATEEAVVYWVEKAEMVEEMGLAGVAVDSVVEAGPAAVMVVEGV